LHLVVSNEPESRSLELTPNITVELNDKNEMVGVENSEGQRIPPGHSDGTQFAPCCVLAILED
jgi:hypothetical protein